jgi:hypothetical protein
MLKVGAFLPSPHNAVPQSLAPPGTGLFYDRRRRSSGCRRRSPYTSMQQLLLLREEIIMLTCTLNQETGILEVQEVLMSFHKTTTRFWYYDTRKWIKSSHGKAGDTPDRIMTAEDIKWVKDNYLPKANELLAA